MSDQNVPATKQDIQLLIEAVSSGFNDLRTEFKEDIKDLKDEMNEKFRDSHGFMKVLVEETFYELKNSKSDQVSVHQDILEKYKGVIKNLEKRLSNVEAKIISL